LNIPYESLYNLHRWPKRHRYSPGNFWSNLCIWKLTNQELKIDFRECLGATNSIATFILTLFVNIFITIQNHGKSKQSNLYRFWVNLSKSVDFGADCVSIYICNCICICICILISFDWITFPNLLMLERIVLACEFVIVFVFVFCFLFG